MGLRPSFPLQAHTSFTPPKRYAATSTRPSEDRQQSFYHWVQTPYWSKLEKQRKELAATREKFANLEQSGMSTECKSHDLEALVVVFRTIDINEDGLIDFNELCSVLDEIGDDTTDEQRRKYFLDIDLDHSEGIDFEEFLNLIGTMSNQEDTGELQQSGFTRMLQEQNYARFISKTKQLSVINQLKYGLF